MKKLLSRRNGRPAAPMRGQVRLDDLPRGGVGDAEIADLAGPHEILLAACGEPHQWGSHMTRVFGSLEQPRLHEFVRQYTCCQRAEAGGTGGPGFAAMTQRRTDTSAIHTSLVLMKAHRTLTRRATRSIEALDMCFSDFAILEALLHKGPQPVRELARRIDLTSGSMTTAIDRLETRHLVTRADHATDRRAWVIHLTPKGEALITKVFAGHQEAMEQAMRGLSKTERATLTDLLKRLGTTAEEQLETGGSQ
jgi:MarR family transcriptional regulator, 2-MHQ and catechol-resistance regulon repressor